MASLTSSWRPLPTTTGDDGQLLLRYEFGTDRCAVYITDLSTIWHESIDAAELSSRARSHTCPIDPDVDVKQRVRLLELVSNALDGATGTSLTLTTQRRGGDLVLRSITRLPQPLPELQWSFRLTKQAGKSSLQQVTGPLIEKSFRQSEDVHSLLSIIKEKDHVISRLFDRLEALSSDVTAIFPGTANVRLRKHTSTRSQLARYVKGLAPLDHNYWQHSQAPVPDVSAFAKIFDGTATLSNDSVCLKLYVPVLSDSLELQARPVELNDTSVIAAAPDPGIITAQSDEQNTESEEEQFETQVVNVKKESTKDKPAIEPQARTPVLVDGLSDHKPSASIGATRLGIIGGKRNDIRPSSHTSQHGAEQDLVRSELSTESEVQAPPSSSTSRLGIIGGRKKDQAITPGTATGEDSSDLGNEKVPLAATSHPLTEYGEDGKATSGLSPRDTTPSMPAVVKDADELSREQANGRREQLKRQLETQREDIGKKKKRKF